MIAGIEIWKIVICLVVGYVFGLIQTGYFYTKAKGINIRAHGSGNVGMTNVLRTMGKKSGIIVFAGDFLKTVIPMMLFRYVIFRDDPFAMALAMFAGLGVVVGHNFPFYLKFKGGKGITATVGIIVSTDWRFFFIGFALFLVIFLITRYISVFSLALISSFPVLLLIFYYGHWVEFVIALILCAVGWWIHRANIKRLISGNENKFSKKRNI